MIVIFGATGNTGAVATKVLLSQGKPVRAVARHREKLAELEKLGAQPMAGDLEDVGFVREALSGAEAAYFLIPPNMAVDDFRAYQKRVIAAVGDAAEGARLTHAVLLSSLGGEHPSGTGPIVGLHEIEERLKKISSLNLLVVRAGYFMPNVLGSLGLMKHQGINGAPAPGQAPITFVFPADIGKYVGERLARLDFQGKTVVNLIGPEVVTLADATALLGKAVGKSFPYVQFSPQDAEKGMIQGGLKPQMAALYVEMYQGAAEGKLGAEPGTPVERLPTSFETFANTVFAPIFRNA